ncbi:MAG: pyridoxamine 5'-phosphate oxidase family protein [Oscillospiraceae bacterium]|jgi:uncharacterized pyridoxamine 5'-phosphate oxidase family protein|nr:pyridoxamine 5'-phosphate oxidase family protein [Oscillospiraceae bacterium]
MSSKATEFLKAAGTFYIATVEGDQPRVRPFGAVAEIDGKTYLSMNKTKKVFAQLIANPKAEITGMIGADWFRLSGKLVHDDSDEARKKMIEANPNVGGMYKFDDGIFAVFYFEEVHGVLESFAGKKEEF